MAIHGFEIPDDLSTKTFKLLPSYFTTYKVQCFIQTHYANELEAAAKATKSAPGRARHSADSVEIANRVADKLVQAWKKKGLVVLRRDFGGQWMKTP